jgi:hypothetical protein
VLQERKARRRCLGEWEDDCARCGDGSGLRVLCGYCHLVFHPTCLDPLTGVENWDDEVFACGRCVTDAMGKAVSTMGGALEHAGYGSAAMGWRWSMLATAARPWPDAVPALPVPASSLPGDDATEFRDSKGEHEDAMPTLAVPHSRVRRTPLALCGSEGEQHKRHAPRGGGSSGSSDCAFRPSELAELNAIEYAAKYATKTKPGDYVIDCAPPVAGGAAAAAAVAASEGGRCFTKYKECPLSAYAAAAAAVTAPLGTPGNERGSATAACTCGGTRPQRRRSRRPAAASSKAPQGGRGGRKREREGGGGGGHPPTGCQPTGPPNPNPTRARRTPRHTRRD